MRSTSSESFFLALGKRFVFAAFAKSGTKKVFHHGHLCAPRSKKFFSFESFRKPYTKPNICANNFTETFSSRLGNLMRILNLFSRCFLKIYPLTSDFGWLKLETQFRRTIKQWQRKLEKGFFDVIYVQEPESP